MASRPTRSQARKTRSTSANNSLNSTPPLKNRTRKSMGLSTPPQINRNVPSKQSKRRRVSSDSSNDSVVPTAGPSRIQDSSDSEDVDISSKKKPNQKKTQKPASDNEGSDNDYVPPVKGTGRGRNSLPSTSGIRSSSTTSENVAQGITNMTLNTSPGSKMSMNTSTQGIMKWANKCVFYILVADQKKHAIKKADIVKNVFKDQNCKENYSAVLQKANEILKKTFGLEILEIKNTKNSYILINILDSDHGIREFAEYPPEEQQKRGLIFLLLTIIFMNGNSITEDMLWKALEPLGLYSNPTITHPIFGNVKKYITSDLVKEMYLEYTCVNKDPMQYELTWGERAVQEIKKEDLLEFACKVIGDNTKPEDWKLQFIDAKGKPSTSEV